MTEVSHLRTVFKNSFPERFHSSGPANPNFSNAYSRLKSFYVTRWPAITKPQDLAEAGFYFEGHDDRVICFSCNGGLKNWEPNDIPWVEHAKWFPKCQYLQLKKTRSFIDDPETHHKRNNQGQAPAAACPRDNVSVKKLLDGSCPSSPNSSQEVDDDFLAPEELRKEYEKLKDEKMCRVCFVQESNVIFLPCGHLVTCPDCAAAVSKCPVCRGCISHMQKVFRS